MLKKIYPEIDVNFCEIGDLLHIRFTTFGECNNGEVIKISEGYTHRNKDQMKQIEFVINCTNRFHVMCQYYIKEKI